MLKISLAGNGNQTAGLRIYYCNDLILEFMMECRGIIHVVREGDTLYTLSRKYHVPLPQVMYANPFVDIYNLQAGDEICIPVSLKDGMNDGR